MRARLAGIAVVALGAFGLAPVVPGSAAPADVTPPYGPFQFSTQGLGKTDSYGEPSLAIAPDGRHVLVSTPGNGGDLFWYSGDDGHTWGTSFTSYGGGDSQIDFLPDGTAVSADLRVGPPTPDSGIGISHDFGKTWTCCAGAGTEQDRQWLAHSPDGKTLYLVYHDFAAEGEFIARSTDGGHTWTQGPPGDTLVNSVNQATALPIFLGGHPGGTASIYDQGVNTFSGPLLIDPPNNGKDQYVVYSISDFVSNINPTAGVPPYGPVRALVVAHSTDHGATWSNVLADVAQINGVNESTENTLFPWGFLDSAGNVYVVFDSTRDGAPGDHFHQYYVYSIDKGSTWSAPIKIDGLPLGAGSTVYATGDGGGPGVIDIGWYQSDTGTPSNDTSTWVPHFAQVTNATSAHPKVVEQAITTVPNHVGGICLQGILCGIGPGSSDRSLLDFFQVKINPVTHLAEFAYADNNRLGKDAQGNKIGEVVVAHQGVAAAQVAAPAPTPPVTVATAELPPTSRAALPAVATITLAGGLVAAAGIGALLLARRRRARA
jgi:hypothetical protein